MRITVLGAGSWGTTMASLTALHHDTTLWAREPGLAEEITTKHTNGLFLPGLPLQETLRAVQDPAEAVAGAELLIVGIPSHAFRSAVAQVADVVPAAIPVISLAKGLEQGSMLRTTQIAAELLPGHPVAALTGPNLAKEILAGKAAATVIACEDQTVASALQKILRLGLVRVYTNTDVIGCEFGGALKNVIALAAGMAQGLDVGDNTRAAVITRGLAELTTLGTALGGRPETFAGLAGMGDLMATCISPQSRNRYVGEQLGQGRKLADILAEMTQVAEGVRTAEVVVELGDLHHLALPICRTVHHVLNGKLTAADAYAGLRHTPARRESDPW